MCGGMFLFIKVTVFCFLPFKNNVFVYEFLTALNTTIASSICQIEHVVFPLIFYDYMYSVCSTQFFAFIIAGRVCQICLFSLAA